ncbi:MAG: helix-turn-helix domain-containing protein [Bacteroidota bacterium]
MYKLGQFDTTNPERLKSEVEQKTTFTLNRCELNIFETHKPAENIKLSFGGFTVTSMLRGKKILRMGENDYLNYIPGETFMVQADHQMCINFPEANKANPTQCTALVIENAYLQKQLEYINETIPKQKELGTQWDINLNLLFLQNDEQIAKLSTRLIHIFSSNDPMKDILVDLKLKELILAIMRLQNVRDIDYHDISSTKVNLRFKAVVDYIRRNITVGISAKQLSNIACMSKSVFYRTFTNEFGMAPNQMILHEKIKYAKLLMKADDIKIKEVCFAAGFSDPNYFSRVFKKHVGQSPGAYFSQIKLNTQA